MARDSCFSANYAKRFIKMLNNRSNTFSMNETMTLHEAGCRRIFAPVKIHATGESLDMTHKSIGFIHVKRVVLILNNKRRICGIETRSSVLVRAHATCTFLIQRHVAVTSSQPPTVASRCCLLRRPQREEATSGSHVVMQAPYLACAVCAHGQPSRATVKMVCQ